MPIKAGSGSLKYPLLNWAQTVAQQSAAAAGSGGSASASAYGANRAFAANKMRVQADLANSAAERQYRAMSQLEGQAFQGDQAEQQRNYNAIQNQNQINAYADRQQAGFDNAKELQQGYQTFTADQNQKQQDFQSGRDQTQFDQNTAAMEAHIQAGKMQLNPAAQDKLNKLEADRATIESDGTFTNAQVNEFMQQYRIKKAGIISTATPTQTQADAFNQGVIHYDEATGQAANQAGPGTKPMRLDKNGMPQPIVTNPNAAKEQAAQQKQMESQQKDQQKQLEDLHKEANDIRKASAKDGETPMSFEDALAEARKNRATSGLGVPAAPQQAAPTAQQPGAAQQPLAPAATGPIPPAQTPQTFNMQSNGARIESANRADIYGAPPPQPMPPNDSAQPARPQPVAGNYSIPGATGGGELQGNGARMGQQNVINSPQAVQQRSELRGGPAAGWQGPPAMPKSEQDYASLPSGARYVDSSGNVRTKL